MLADRNHRALGTPPSLRDAFSMKSGGVCIKKEQKTLLFCLIVRVIGLEPTRRKTPDPKSGASTNFATRATVPAKVV